MQKKTLAQLISKVYRRLGDPAMINPTIDREDIKDCINEAQREIAVWIHCLYAEYTTSAKANQQEYNLGDIGGTDEELAERTLRVRFLANGRWKVLKATTKLQLDEDHDGWLNADAGTPEYFWVHGNFLGLYPKPDKDVTDGIWWEGFIMPPPLEEEGDICELPPEYQRYIVDHAFYNYKGDMQALEILEQKLRVIGQQHEIRRVHRRQYISVKRPYRFD